MRIISLCIPSPDPTNLGKMPADAVSEDGYIDHWIEDDKLVVVHFPIDPSTDKKLPQKISKVPRSGNEHALSVLNKWKNK